MTPRRAACFGLLVLSFGVTSSTPGLAVDASHAKARRTSTTHPSKVVSDKSNADKTAPDVTATIGRPASSVPAPTPESEPLPPPYLLPTASRARVRACGMTWRDMKLAGRTGDDDWRDFAVKCFTAKDSPSSKP